YNNLSALIKSFKNTFENNFKNGKLPFIAADFVQDWKNKNPAICEPVVSAMKAVCDDIDFGAFVETDGLKSNAEENGGDDDIHFSRKSLMLLGERYFDEFRGVCSFHDF
ncbi:MAG: sialate O-acetylesterase, partial [Oscillospiraceae bacterium]|nr:sialate O-acetylesterase [Oscillospiraceae bacterium]